jgi:predicted NACHT family NTPase
MVGYLEHRLETFYQCSAPAGLVGKLLLTGRALMIFDGLDELLEPARRADVAARIERFCSEYPLARVLVTSRVVGYDQARLDDRQLTRLLISQPGPALYAACCCAPMLYH